LREKANQKNLKWISLIVGTFIGFGLIVYFLPLGDIYRAIKEISLKSLVLGLFLYTLSYIFRTWRWKYYYPSVSFNYLFFTTAVNTLFNNLLPARLGESSIFLLLKKYDSSLKETVKKFLKVRLLDGFSLLTLLTFSVFYLKINPLVGTILALLIYPLGVSVLNLTSKVWKKIPSLQIELLPFLLSLGNLISKLLAVYIVLDFLHIGFIKFIAGFIGGEISSILPFHSFAGLGSYETAFSATLKFLFNENFKEGFKIAFLSHAFLLFASLLLGGISLIALIRKS